MKRALLAVCGLLVLVIAAGAATYALTPSVGNAEARVRALARDDGASDLGAPVPPKFAESIVASEDSRFYAEPGIDPIGIARAAWMTLTGSRTDPGGSTLSQQLAKQLYTNGRTGVLEDTEQVALAVKLNLRYGKRQILRMYADTVYFGHGFYGLHNASCGYFAVLPQRMSLPQASMLAGLVQAPSAYDPLKHLGLARTRQRYVLGRLAATGKITPARAQSAEAAPLHLHSGGTAGACHG